MPYNRENLTPRGIISDTFESAITWDRFESFYHAVKDATQQAIREATGQEGAVSCRFSHAYPDGPAPYFAFHCAGRPGSMLEQWRDIKRAVSDAVIDNGGTITHHHAIGRDHQPWYEKQRPGAIRRCPGSGQGTFGPARNPQPGSARAKTKYGFAGYPSTPIGANRPQLPAGSYPSRGFGG